MHTISRLGRALRVDQWPMFGRPARRAGRLINALLYGESGVDALIDNRASLKLSPKAFSGGNYVFEPILTTALQELAARGVDFLDVGGHIGITSLLYAHFAEAKVRVATLEPNPATFPILVENARLNGSRIEPYRLALGDHVHLASFHYVGSAQNASLSADAPGQALDALRISRQKLETTTVPVTTVDDFCHALGLAPGLIKVDVEGAELHVLKGGAKTLRLQRPLVLLETHVFAWPSFGYTSTDLDHFISEVGYVVCDLKGERFHGSIGTGTEGDNNYYLLKPNLNQ